jgi:hypothetical protein
MNALFGGALRPERDRLWQLVCEAFPLYASYQRKTTRLIPLFVLDFERSE